LAPDSRGKRILLVAHWDSRPWADEELSEELRQKPIEGANDGASGVAVLLEIARQLGLERASEPVDILLIDGEDYGAPEGKGGDETTWCLGTQAWILSGMPYDFATQPRYAILLDMVGGRDARFHREVISDYMAPEVVDMAWSRAKRLGLGDRFVNERGGTVVDDHLFLNRAGIPAIDIIE
ncbi:MAG: M28 family peptidase, partial [Muribaculaceae bacterium]|nr:M28 family peptidase [Muribaculaceae bacterium]